MKQALSPSLRKLQARSGLAFGIFLILHLGALAASVLGPGWYDAVQAPTRAVYGFWPVEVALLLTMAVHMAIGVYAAWQRRKLGLRPAAPPPTRLRLQRYTAWFLALVIVGHVAATRLPDLLYDAPPRFVGVSFTMWYAPLFFVPYYLVLPLAGLYHLLNGGVLAMGRLGRPLPSALRSGRGFWTLFAFLALLCTLGWASLGGWLYEIEDPRDCDFARAGEALGVVEAGTTISSGKVEKDRAGQADPNEAGGDQGDHDEGQR